MNAGGKRFIEGGYALGADVDLEGRGVAVGDLDRDGSLDLVMRSVARQKLLYFHNEIGGRRHFLRVSLVGTGKSNRDAVGAVVRAHVGKLTMTRVRTIGNGFMSQSEPDLHFGLGDATVVESLEVRWPSGRTERFANLPADHEVRIVEGQGRFAASLPPGRKAGPSVAAPPPAPTGSARFVARTVQGAPFVAPVGKPLIVSLWATWCKSCRAEVAILNEAQDKLGDAAGIVAVTFDEREPAAVQRFVQQMQPRYPVAVSTRAEMAPLLSAAFGDGAVPLPSAVLLDAAGKVSRVYAGDLSAAVLAADARALAARK